VKAEAVRAALRCDRPSCICRRARTVHCPNHPDRSPSFVVDEAGERLLVHCHGGCDQHDVIAALQARELWPSSARPSFRKETRSPLDQARREILLEARRQQARLEHYAELFAESDSIRVADRLIREARTLATQLGPREDVFAWLWQVAALELDTRMAEARLDDDLMAKVIP
jgi:hypothetical protein